MATAAPRCSQAALSYFRQCHFSSKSSSLLSSLRLPLRTPRNTRIFPGRHTRIRGYATGKPSPKPRAFGQGAGRTIPPSHLASSEAQTSQPFPVAGNHFASVLASKSSSTLLYVSTTSGWWQVGRTLIAGFIIFGCYDHLSYSFLDPPPGMPWFTPYLNAVWIAIGGGFLLLIANPVGRGPVRSIMAKPVANGLKLVVEGTPLQVGGFQLWPSQTIEAAVNDVKFKRSVIQQQLPASIKERKELYEREANMHRTKGWLVRALQNVKKTFQQNVLREKFMKMSVQGKSMNLDLRDGWMLDKGQALERLVNNTTRSS